MHLHTLTSEFHTIEAQAAPAQIDPASEDCEQRIESCPGSWSGWTLAICEKLEIAQSLLNKHQLKKIK